MSRTRITTDATDEAGNTLLIRAALDGQTETVEALLRKGADVNARNREGRTALMFAVINLRTATVKTLLRFGADVNIQAECGCTPLMLAACSGDIGITQALLKSGADARKVCSPGKTALVVAIEHGYDTIVDLLKQHEARQDLHVRKGAKSRWKNSKIPPTEVGGRFRSNLQATTDRLLESHQRQLVDASDPTFRS